ncbi:T9SS type A sorting domain-containing protein [bacterium]|nr:T9SS type A sorting domain-containing protein [bacterium]
MKSGILLAVFLLTLSFGAMTANSQHFTPVDDTGLPYAIVIDSVIHETNLTPAVDEIAVFDGDLCVGMGYYSDANFSVTAWEGDPGFGFLGFDNGNPIQFRIFVSMDNLEYFCEAEFTEGDGTFGSGPYTAAIVETGVVNSLEENDTWQPMEFEILSLYPNPFNEVATLTLSTSHTQMIELSLFNLLGGEIFRGDKFLAVGTNRIELSASVMNLQHTGTYFFRIQADGKSFMEKIIYLK